MKLYLNSVLRKQNAVTGIDQSFVVLLNILPGKFAV